MENGSATGSTPFMALLYLEPLPPRLTKGELLAFLCASGSIDGKRIGRIERRGATAIVEIPDGWKGKLVKGLDGASLKHRRLRAWSDAGQAVGAWFASATINSCASQLPSRRTMLSQSAIGSP